MKSHAAAAVGDGRVGSTAQKHLDGRGLAMLGGRTQQPQRGFTDEKSAGSPACFVDVSGLMLGKGFVLCFVEHTPKAFKII